jgi:hypothetical protein
MSLAARCQTPLYERQLSASNADSTLRIVKEQQPTKKSRLANRSILFLTLWFANQV